MCNASGFGFNGYDSHGLPKWDLCTNVNILGIEVRCFSFFHEHTVEPVLSSHSKIGKTKILMTNDSFMKVESIAECSKGSILQYF